MSQERLDSFEGKTIGDFRIVRKVGQGGMGLVLEAEQLSLGNRRVALKLLPLIYSADERAVERFRREASLAARLNHPNIAQVFAIGEELGLCYYAMQYVEGKTLHDIIEQVKGGLSDAWPMGETSTEVDSSARAQAKTVVMPREAPGAKTPPPGTAGPPKTSGHQTNYAHIERCVGLIIQAAMGLAHAHENGIIHRDIKPSNLMLDRTGRLLIMDFGLAREASGSRVTLSGDFLGTPCYMSPEQVASTRVTIDHRTDIYSLGVTLYELLTLQLPFEGETRERLLNQIVFKEPPSPRKVQARIPRDLETIILKALEKDPDQRYKSATEFADDLQKFLRGEPVAARPVGTVARVARRAKRHKFVLSVVLIAFLVILTAFALFAKKRSEDKIADAARRAGGFLEAKDYYHALKAAEDLERLSRHDARLPNLLTKCTGDITVHTDPPGARVSSFYIHPETAKVEEGRDILGDTPLERRRVAVGSYHIQIEKPGMAPLEFIMEVGPGKETREERQLLNKEDVPEGMVFVPAGEFILGRVTALPPASASGDNSTVADERLSPKSRQVSLPSFFIGKNEVSEQDFGSFLDEFPYLRRFYRNPLQPYSTKSAMRIPATPSWLLATRYCEWISKKMGRKYRLPTEEEWEKAARGTDGRKMPWGNNVSKGWMAKARIQLIAIANDPSLLMEKAHAIDISPYGCHDMGGMAPEWCSDRRYCFPPPYGVSRQSHPVRAVTLEAESIFDVRTSISDGNELGRVGFRVCAEAPRRLGGRGEDFDPKSEIPKLIADLKAPDPSVRELAAHSLGLLGPEARTAISALSEAVGKEKDGIVRLAEETAFDKVAVERARELFVLVGHSAPVACVAFSPDGRRLASASWDGTLRMWDVQTGQPIRSPLGYPDQGKALGGKALSLGICFKDDEAAQVKVKDVLGDSPAEKAGLAPGDSLIAFDGKPITRSDQLEKALGLQKVGSEVEVLFVRMGQKYKTKLKLAAMPEDYWVLTSGRACFVAFSPNGKRIAAGCGDGMIRVWDVEKGTEDLVLKGHSQWVGQVHFSPDGKLIGSVSYDGTVRLWDSQSGKRLSVLWDEGKQVRCMAFSPDSRCVAAASIEGLMMIWDAQTEKVVKGLRGHAGAIWFIAYSPDGKTLAVAGSDGAVRILNLETRREAIRLRRNAAMVHSVAFSPDGKWVLSGGGDRAASLWEAASGREVMRLEGHTSSVRPAAAGVDGRRIGTGWLNDGDPCIPSVAFSPDGRRMATAGSDDTIIIWEGMKQKD